MQVACHKANIIVSSGLKPKDSTYSLVDVCQKGIAVSIQAILQGHCVVYMTAWAQHDDVD